MEENFKSRGAKIETFRAPIISSLLMNQARPFSPPPIQFKNERASPPISFPQRYVMSFIRKGFRTKIHPFAIAHDLKRIMIILLPYFSKTITLII